MKHRRKLGYFLSVSRHVERYDYYVRGLLHQLKPYALCKRETERLLRGAETHPDRDEIERRARYYNKLTQPFDASDAPRIMDIERDRSRYFLDLNEVAKGFGPNRRLDYLFGDIRKVPSKPMVLKSRPIVGDNANSILLKLNKTRHFSWSPDPVPFRDKKPAAVWRGTARTKQRQRLVEKFYDHPTFDIGHTGRDAGGREPKRGLTHEEQKQFRYFISLEGNDVATNLKWGMASNMLVMSPALHYETWFMEGELEPNKHFVLLRDDFEDLEERIAYFEENPRAAEAIISEAHRWLDQFADTVKERMIAAKVLQRYFELSGQM